MDNHLPDLDPDTQHALCELMGASYAALVQTFMRDIERRQMDMHSALASADWEQLGRAAHSLGGSCADMGALALREACVAVEVVVRQGDVRRVAACCQRIDWLCARLLSQLPAFC